MSHFLPLIYMFHPREVIPSIAILWLLFDAAELETMLDSTDARQTEARSSETLPHKVHN